MDLRSPVALAVVAAAILMVASALPTTVRAQARPVRPVPSLDLDKYMGRWYELGRYPNRFQKRCAGDVVVFYEKRPDGRVDVRNTCQTDKGPIEAVGVARQVDPKGPTSVLEVRFAPAWLSFLPVWGAYWVLDLAPDYSTAVVGSPDRDYLWLLSRTPHVDQPTYARLVEAARSQGFDPARIECTRHTGQ